MESRPNSRSLVWFIGLAAALVLAAAAARSLPSWLSAVPVDGRSAAGPIADELPADCAVVAPVAGTVVQAPFEVAASAASPSGLAVWLYEGHGDKERCAGRAALPVRVRAEGRYRLWLRCRWADSCSNSLGVGVDGSDLTTVGQDAVYDLWHWVDAGDYLLAAGAHTIVLAEREDGVAVDQALLCPSAAALVPAGPILEGRRQGAGLRRFADAFDRSPGHGNEGWLFQSGTWDIAFSLDPNRVPLQYALAGVPAAGQWAVAAVAGPPWRGAAVDVAFRCDAPETAVGVLFSSSAGALAVMLGAKVPSAGPGGATVVTVDDVTIEPGQWYRLEVERWAWSVRVRLDGRLLRQIDGLPSAECGVPALLVAGAPAALDDVMVREVPWEADDGRDFRMAWVPVSGARWYRPRSSAAGWALAARRGALRHAITDGPVGEVVTESAGDRADLRLDLPGYDRRTGGLACAWVAEGDPPRDLVLNALGPCRLTRLSVRLAPPVDPDMCHLGVYHFTESYIEDLADYLDFTPDEYRAIQASPDVERLRREAKQFALVGRSTDEAVWEVLAGHWVVRDGALYGSGRDGALRFWRTINGPFTAQLRVRLADAETAARLLLAESGSQGIALRLAGPGAPAGPDVAAAVIPPGEWHSVVAELTERSLTWRVDEGETRRTAVTRGTAGGVILQLERGRVEFDDILFSLPRHTGSAGAQSRFYAFDCREPDWWRRGNWLDHGGIACAVASSWISLESPDEAGYLIHKESFGPDVQVALTVEENTEWLGWDQDPSHRHFPEDNVHVLLLRDDRNVSRGYRLEVNSGEGRRTVLYRDGVEVAAVTPDSQFPMRYVGGHAPYRPRRNRVSLERQGDRLRAVINGVEVLSCRDPQPLPTTTVAIGGTHTRVNFTNVLVRELLPGAGP